MDYDDYTYGQFNEDTVNEYGMGEKDDIGNYSMRLYKELALLKFSKWQAASSDVGKESR